MARRTFSPKVILTACEMVYQGASHVKVGEKLGVSKRTLVQWKKTELWREFERELIAATKAEILNGESGEAFQEG